MNTNPEAITVLCYGDSNTNGTKPDRSGRFKTNERWTGILQNNLGDEYYVIEEGLGGRTTDLDHPNTQKPSRDGLIYFKACIDSHMPLDIVLIMLGTNDLKTAYKRNADDVAQALKQYPDYITQYCEQRKLKRPRIIIMSPAHMDETAAKFDESMPTPGIYDEESAEKSKLFAEPFKKLAKETGCEFFDAAQVASTGEDGCHITLEGHNKLGDAMTSIIKPSN